MRHGDLGDLDQLQRFAAQPLDKEDLWKRFQAHMGYTDAEMAVFRSDPLRVKMVTESPEFVKSRFIAHSDPNNERRIDTASSSQVFTVIAGPPGTLVV